MPYVEDYERMELETHDLNQQFFSVIAHYGFMEDIDVPKGLTLRARYGLLFYPEQTLFFLSREIAIPSNRPGIALWREHFFALDGTQSQ